MGPTKIRHHGVNLHKSWYKNISKMQICIMKEIKENNIFKKLDIL